MAGNTLKDAAASQDKGIAESKALRVAIVHDWMLLGGAEKVVEQLLTMYPNAPLYTSCISKEWSNKLKDKVIITGYLNKPLFIKLRKFIPFLRQRWFEHLNLSKYDLVISSSGAEAKGIKVPKHVFHISYCHAPTHYYWSRYESYIKDPGFGPFNWLARFGLKLLVRPMRKWDLAAAQRPDIMIANSTHTAAEIKKYYRRYAAVVHPPVAIAGFPLSSTRARSGFVVAGRQTPYKRFDLAVVACTKLGLPLTVIGTGPEHQKLKAMAGPTITFTGYIPSRQIAAYFQRAAGFIFAGLDDFGITPVEAMAAGCPVIAYKAGGALDYVIEGRSGIFFTEQTTESLVEALKQFQNMSFNQKEVHAVATQFSPSHFRTSMQRIINESIQSGGKL